MTKNTIRFDDLAALRARIRDDFGGWSPAIEVPQQMIDAFAEMTGDRQWIHVDRERADASAMGTTIAHGFLVLSLSSVIKNSTDLEIEGHGSALNYGLDKVRFVSPVPSGASIHGRTRLVAVAEEKGGTMVTYAVAIHQVGADRPAVCFDWKLLYRA